MSAKDILAKVKAIFADTATDPANQAPPAVTDPSSTQVYTLQDGTEISITLKDPAANAEPSAGDMVTIAGAPAPAGTLTLQDGTIIVVDATGAITSFTEPGEPATTDLTKAPPANVPPPAQSTPPTNDQVKAASEKFATGTPEERLANLEVVAKAVMENVFGWQINEATRIANQNAAIQVYQNSLKMATDKADAQGKLIEKHEKTIAGLFELVEELVKVPTADPKTLTGPKKEAFEKAEKREKKFEAIAASLKKMKEEKK